MIKCVEESFLFASQKDSSVLMISSTSETFLLFFLCVVCVLLLSNMM